MESFHGTHLDFGLEAIQKDQCVLEDLSFSGNDLHQFQVQIPCQKNALLFHEVTTIPITTFLSILSKDFRAAYTPPFILPTILGGHLKNVMAQWTIEPRSPIDDQFYFMLLHPLMPPFRKRALHISSLHSPLSSDCKQTKCFRAR